MKYPDGVILLDGLDAALLGVGSQWGREPVAVYSERKILAALRAQGMEPDEAQEWYSYNIRCMGVGVQTPLILEAERSTETFDDSNHL